jgi:hypothetical protein
MKFLCGSCKTKYQIADARVQGLVLTIICKKCGSKMVVREVIAKKSPKDAIAEVLTSERSFTRDLCDRIAVGAGELATEAMHPSPPSEDVPVAARAEWYVAIRGEQKGPMPFTELARRILAHEVRPSHHVWHEAMDNWRLVKDEPALVPFIPPPPLVRPLPPPPDTARDLASLPARPKIESPRPHVSTRLLLQAAGVRERRQRHRFAFAVSATFGVMILAFVAGWAGGFIQLAHAPKEELAPAPRPAPAPPVAEPRIEEKVSRERVRKLGEDPAEKRRLLPAKRALEAKPPVGVPRGDEVSSIPFDAAAADREMRSPPDAVLPRAIPADAVLPESPTGQLKPEAVTAIIRARRQSIAGCYEQALKSNAAIHGKLELDMTIDPDGSVTSVRVLTLAKASKPIADCIAEKIREWRFPSFSGQTPQEVRVPFILEH